MRRALGLLLANVAGLVLLLGALELGARFLAPSEPPRPLLADELEDWVSKREFHPRLFWRMTPRRDESGAVVVNELGLRGPLPEPKGDDEYRILSLGESTTLALRLPFERTYTNLLARRLTRTEGRRVTAVNAGVGGYSLAQGVALAELHGFDLEPDLVLTYFGYNDLLRVGFRAERDAAVDETAAGLTDLELMERRRRLLARGLLALQRWSHFARWATLSDAPTEVRRGRKPRVPAEDRLRLYHELRELCRQRDARLVVLVPVYRSFDRHEAFLRSLGEAGFEVVDLPSLLGPRLGERREWFFDAVHPRAPLHRLIARAVADHLAASLGGRDAPPDA